MNSLCPVSIGTYCVVSEALNSEKGILEEARKAGLYGHGCFYARHGMGLSLGGAFGTGEPGQEDCG